MMLPMTPGIHHEEQEYNETEDQKNDGSRFVLPKQLQSPEVHANNLNQEQRTARPSAATRP